MKAGVFRWVVSKTLLLQITEMFDRNRCESWTERFLFATEPRNLVPELVEAHEDIEAVTVFLVLFCRARHARSNR